MSLVYHCWRDDKSYFGCRVSTAVTHQLGSGAGRHSDRGEVVEDLDYVEVELRADGGGVNEQGSSKTGNAMVQKHLIQIA